ncbi:hypothetical protein ACNR9V_20525 (plasmid) [Parageobacillus thermoglucosidasius]
MSSFLKLLWLQNESARTIASVNGTSAGPGRQGQEGGQPRRPAQEDA